MSSALIARANELLETTQAAVNSLKETYQEVYRQVTDMNQRLAQLEGHVQVLRAKAMERERLIAAGRDPDRRES